MDWFLRIYGIQNSLTYQEIPLPAKTDFFVGAQENDDFRLPISSHLCLHAEEDGVHVSCSNEVYHNGEKQTEFLAKHGDSIGLHAERGMYAELIRISGVCHQLTFANNEKILFGRNPACSVVLHNKRASAIHCSVTFRNGAYYVCDERSQHGTFLNKCKLLSETQLVDGDVLTFAGYTATLRNKVFLLQDSGDFSLHIKYTTQADAQDVEPDDTAEILFHRSPRLQQEIPSGEITIEAPPNIGSKPEINWLSTLSPVLSAGVMSVILLLTTKGAMAYMSLVMAGIGVVVSLLNYCKQRKKHNLQQAARAEKYAQHLEEKKAEIEQKRAEQLAAVHYANPDTLSCVHLAQSRERNLWARRPQDPDFMHLRLGSGEQEFAVAIKVPSQALSLEEDDLRNKPQQIANQYKTLADSPITCNIVTDAVCGVVGKPKDTAALLNNLIIQFATHHCYTDAKLIFVHDASKTPEHKWIKDLPHVCSGQSSFYADTKESAEELLNLFEEVLKKRKIAEQDSRNHTSLLPYYLFVFADSELLDQQHPINRLLFEVPISGVGIFFSAEDITQLPKECQSIVSIIDRSGELYKKSTASAKKAFTVDPLPPSACNTFGRALKSLRCNEIAESSVIPKNFSFFDMLQISNVQELDLLSRWKNANIIASMATPIGIQEKGKLLCLDLNETAHGPHGLLAGTTGSGKSEVLLSLILSLSVSYHPHEVGFVIIDFKGGGMANQLNELPHLLGTITNIDNNSVNRSLLSIKAELKRRQQRFKDANVNNISDYIALYKAGKITDAMPHLVIIVDEFAELKAEQPEFMKELISAARIGRSLGVHLILATQKPAGQVNDQIWSNSRFKICLKVQDVQDSQEVLKSPLAASIMEPGRGYLLVGNGEVFSLFQSAYSGQKNKDGQTQLQAIIRHIADTCKTNGIAQLSNICLPPLVSNLPFRSENMLPGWLEIGLCDIPEQQLQRPCSINLLEQNVMIIGSSQMGKTSLLQTAIRNLAEQASPNDVQLYIIDFASMALKTFEPLHHVGGVVTSLEDEKLKNLMKLLFTEIERRKKLFLSAGVSSFAAYREAGLETLPHIVLMVDNLAALREMYLQDEDPLLGLCQNGLSYGISVIVANNHTTGLGYRYLSNFACRIALFCNDSGEYHTLFEQCRMRIDNIPGRCIVEQDKKLLECQTYLAFHGEKEIDRATNMRAFVAAINEKHPNAKAIPIPAIPERLTADRLEELAPSVQGRITLGLDYDSVSPVTLDLHNLGVLAVSDANPKKGLSFAQHLVHSLSAPMQNAEIHIADGVGKELAFLREYPAVASYSFLPDQAATLVVETEKTLQERYNRLAAGDEAALDTAPYIVLILHGSDVAEAISNDSSAMNAYRSITGKYKNMNVCVFLTGFENVNIPYGAPEVLKKAKEARQFVFFDELSNLKIFDLPFAVLKKFKKPLGHGTGYYIKDNECLKIETVLE